MMRGFVPEPRVGEKEVTILAKAKEYAMRFLNQGRVGNGADGLKYCAGHLRKRRLAKFPEGRWKELGLKMADRLEEYFKMIE